MSSDLHIVGIQYYSAKLSSSISLHSTALGRRQSITGLHSISKSRFIASSRPYTYERKSKSVSGVDTFKENDSKPKKPMIKDEKAGGNQEEQHVSKIDTPGSLKEENQCFTLVPPAIEDDAILNSLFFSRSRQCHKDYHIQKFESCAKVTRDTSKHNQQLLQISRSIGNIS